MRCSICNKPVEDGELLCPDCISFNSSDILNSTDVDELENFLDDMIEASSSITVIDDIIEQADSNGDTILTKDELSLYLSNILPIKESTEYTTEFFEQFGETNAVNINDVKPQLEQLAKKLTTYSLTNVDYPTSYYLDKAIEVFLKNNNMTKDDDYIELFINAIDSDGDGELTEKELAYAFSQYIDERSSTKIAKKIIKDGDLDNSNSISLDELQFLLGIMTKSPDNSSPLVNDSPNKSILKKPAILDVDDDLHDFLSFDSTKPAMSEKTNKITEVDFPTSDNATSDNSKKKKKRKVKVRSSKNDETTNQNEYDKSTEINVDTPDDILKQLDNIDEIMNLNVDSKAEPSILDNLDLKKFSSPTFDSFDNWDESDDENDDENDDDSFTKKTTHNSFDYDDTHNGSIEQSSSIDKSALPKTENIKQDTTTSTMESPEIIVDDNITDTSYLDGFDIDIEEKQSLNMETNKSEQRNHIDEEKEKQLDKLINFNALDLDDPNELSKVQQELASLEDEFNDIDIDSLNTDTLIVDEEELTDTIYQLRKETDKIKKNENKIKNTEEQIEKATSTGKKVVVASLIMFASISIFMFVYNLTIPKSDIYFKEFNKNTVQEYFTAVNANISEVVGSETILIGYTDNYLNGSISENIFIEKLDEHISICEDAISFYTVNNIDAVEPITIELRDYTMESALFAQNLKNAIKVSNQEVKNTLDSHESSNKKTVEILEKIKNTEHDILDSLK